MTVHTTFLEPSRCLLLVIDIQERLMPVIAGREQVTKNALLLIKAAKVLGIPTVATTQYACRIGAPLPEISQELGSVALYDKMEFNCFGNREFAAAISVRGGRDTLLVCGVETHICVYQTVLGGLTKGFRMWVAADAVSSRATDNHDVGIGRMRQEGAVIGSTEMIIYELLQKAGTPEFKALLPLMK